MPTRRLDVLKRPPKLPSVSALRRLEAEPALSKPTKCLHNGPVLLATAAKLGIRQERGTRDKLSQSLNKLSRYWLDTGLPEKGKIAKSQNNRLMSVHKTAGGGEG